MTARAVAIVGAVVVTTAILAAGVANYALTALSMPDAGRAPVLAACAALGACAALAVVVLMVALVKAVPT